MGVSVPGKLPPLRVRLGYGPMLSWRKRFAGRPGVVVLCLGFALLVLAWMAATQPFDGPDEPSHYVRAYILSQGEVLGQKVDYLPNPGLDPPQERFIDNDTRGIRIPANLMPGNAACINGRPNRVSCVVPSVVGNFAPLGYVLPAVALAVSHTTSSALWLGRLACALQSLVFLLLAVALLWNGSSWSLLGFLAAVTPMVLFSSSVLNLSGIENGSCLAFVAAALRIARDQERTPTWVWSAFGLAGAVALLTGPIDLAFVLLDLLVVAVLIGRRPLLALARRRAATVAAVAIGAAFVLALVYSRIAGFSHTFGFSPVSQSLNDGFAQFVPVIGSAVGNFAALTVPLPNLALWIWWLLVAGVIGAALWVGSWRERSAVALTTALCLLFPVLFWAWVDRYSGFNLDGREVLPELMLIPLVAGEVLARQRARIQFRWGPRLALSAAVALVAGFQAYSWWLSARAAAGATLYLRFWAHAQWSPPLGWWPWVLSAAAGTVALLSVALGAALGGPGRSGGLAPRVLELA